MEQENGCLVRFAVIPGLGVWYFTSIAWSELNVMSPELGAWNRPKKRYSIFPANSFLLLRKLTKENTGETH